MQVSGRGHQTFLVKTVESVVGTQIKDCEPCPMCKQHFSELKLGQFIKHCYRCKGDISQRAVSCSPPGRYSNSHLSKKNTLTRFFQKPLGNLATRKPIF